MSTLEIRSGQSCHAGATAEMSPQSHDAPVAIGHRPQPGYSADRRSTRVRRHGFLVGTDVGRLPADPDSLAHHLTVQLRQRRDTPRILHLAEWIVWNLETDGYLREELCRLGRMVSATVAEMQTALATVQCLEPTGVGARSLRECLLLQLHAQSDPDPVAVQIVDNHLRLVGHKRYDEVAQALHQPLERIMQAMAAIRRLEPRPGRGFGDVPAQTVRPEAAIIKVMNTYRVVLSDESLPPLRVSSHRWAEAAAEHGEARAYLAQRIQRASSLITAIDRRQTTVRSVVLSIVDHQPDFLEQGPAGLRPLLLRDVAKKVGVHETTVSRTVAHRYVDTPHGVFPLRFFFTNRLPADPAGVVSSVAVRQRIRELVESEDPVHTLSDADIAHALAASGIRIARRTVVKYRDQLGIGRALARRSLSA